jgi:pyrroloquinoline-quinone synthase
VNNLRSAAGLCDEAIEGHALLRHPFYVAWSEGTLPVAALKDYAREYGAFIGAVGRGWEAAGEPEHARVEDGHARVWERTFAAGLGTTVGGPRVAEVSELLTAARELFGGRATALGALYAFEAQQPSTAASKLEGLREHYRQLPAECGEYFRLHRDDYGELSLLKGALDALSADETERAVAACERMSRALYDALTGIHAPYAGRACEGACASADA